MRVGFVQTEPVLGDVDGNLGRALAQLEAADGDLLVLPELFTTGYAVRDRRHLEALAEPADGPAVGALADHCRRRGRFVVAGFAERAPGGFFNSACAVGPGGLLGLYRKVHLFHGEKLLFRPGDLGFPVWDLGPCRVGVLICFDWCFPEAARTLALAGAQVLAHPANLVLPHGQAAMVTRCLENQVFAVTANRVGADRLADGSELRFTGASQVAGPDGSRPAVGDVRAPCAAAVEIDPARADRKWITPANHVLLDRRPEAYALGAGAAVTGRRGSGGVSGALEDYLETILALTEDRGEVRVRDIADARGVRAASVTPALRRLAALGLVDYTRRGSIGLTAAGEQVARRVAARHRALGRLLGDVLRLPAEDVEPVACAMEHALTPPASRRLARFLEFLDAAPDRRQLVAAFHASLRESDEG